MTASWLNDMGQYTLSSWAQRSRQQVMSHKQLVYEEAIYNVCIELIYEGCFQSKGRFCQ